MNQRSGIQHLSLFFLVTFAFTWLICLPGVLSTLGLFQLPIPITPLVAIAQWGPSLTAFLLVYRDNGRAGVEELAKRALKIPRPLRWLAPTVLLPLVLAGSAICFNLLGGGQLPPLQLLSQPALVPFTFVFIFFFQGPVPEEFGWRGYALDRLQEKWNALISSVLLGTLWAIWHLPLFFMGYLSFLPFLPYLAYVVASTILITWLYNNTSGNLLVAMLFHAMSNLSIQVFPVVSGVDQSAFIYLAILHMIAAAFVVLVWGPHKMKRHRDREQRTGHVSLPTKMQPSSV